MELTKEERRLAARLIESVLMWNYDEVPENKVEEYTAVCELFEKLKPKTVKKSGWANVYPHQISGVYPTREKADIVASQSRINCVKVHWEEDE